MLRPVLSGKAVHQHTVPTVSSSSMSMPAIGPEQAPALQQQHHDTTGLWLVADSNMYEDKLHSRTANEASQGSTYLVSSCTALASIDIAFCLAMPKHICDHVLERYSKARLTADIDVASAEAAALHRLPAKKNAQEACSVTVGHTWWHLAADTA